MEITLGFTQEWIDVYDQAEDNHEAFERGLECCLTEICIGQYPDYYHLLDMIHSCLSIEPSKRTSSKNALSHAWLKDEIQSWC